MSKSSIAILATKYVAMNACLQCCFTLAAKERGVSAIKTSWDVAIFQFADLEWGQGSWPEQCLRARSQKLSPRCRS